MPSQSFSDFVEAATDAGTLTTGDLVPVVRGGTTYSTDVSLLGGGGGGGYTEGCGCNAGAQSISNNSATDVSFGSADAYDTDTMHDPSTNPERITATTAGKYLVTFFGNFAPNATGSRYCAIYKNGSTLQDIHRAANLGGSTPTTVNAAMVVNLGAGDYITVRVWQDSGGSLSLASAYCAVQRIG